MRRPRLVHAAGRARRASRRRDPARLPDDQAPRAVLGVPDGRRAASPTPPRTTSCPCSRGSSSAARPRASLLPGEPGYEDVAHAASPRTVAVTGPTGEIGKPFIRALERTPRRQADPRHGAPPVRPEAHRLEQDRVPPGRRARPRGRRRARRGRRRRRAPRVHHRRRLATRATSINLEGSRNVFEAAVSAQAQAARLRVARSPPTASTRTTRSRSPRTSPRAGTEAHPYSAREGRGRGRCSREVARRRRRPTPTSSARASSPAPRRRC